MRWQVVAPVLALAAGITTVAGALVAGTAHAEPQPPPEPSQPTADVPADPLAEPVTSTLVAPAVPSPSATPTAPDTAPSTSNQASNDDAKPRSRVVPEGSEGFRFGSYGRAIAGSDLRGGKPQKIQIVARAPRIIEDSYLELDLSYGFVRALSPDDYVVLRPTITLAFDGTLFHDTGEFDARPALRNMFLDASIAKNVTAWAGSRMYRGDDIYLFDYWPLDDQNIVGAGTELKSALRERGPDDDRTHDEVSIAAAVGFNRLLHPFQYQVIDVPNPVHGSTTIEQLNRQRIVGSATATYTMLPAPSGGLGAKVRVHTEVHSLPSGTRKLTDGTLEPLPADSGFMIGAQAGVFGFAPAGSLYRRHLNLFARYSKGLAAFDELAPPTSFGSDLKTTRANEIQLGLSGNFDHEKFHVMVAALSRRFIDADTSAVDYDDGWEYAIGARPLARIVRGWFVGGDLSYQARFPRGLNPSTLRADDPAMLQIAPMIVYSPMGPSSYDRPQLRFVYRAAKLNQAALDTYVPDDPRHQHEWVHFLGIQAEWWWNSTRYR